MNAARLAALESAKGLSSSPKNIERVATETDVESARWAFTQWELRKRAAAKFEKAEEMLFVREALEQATHEKVAAYRASRFPKGVLVADLTCGIGADLIALARRGPTIGYELDSERLECVRWNLAVHGLEADLRLQNSLETQWDFEYSFADPSRRVQGRRILHPSGFEPRPDALAKRMRSLKLSCLKLSPMIADDFLETLGPGLEFWSFGGECREAAIWLGSNAILGRRAVHIESGEKLDADGAPPRGTIADFFYEADPAAIRAHALSSIADRFGVNALGDSNGYLSGLIRIESPWLESYRLLEELPRDRHAIKRRLSEMGAATPIVKSRIKQADPVELGKLWKSSGARPFIVAAYPVGKSIHFLLLEPLRDSK